MDTIKENGTGISIHDHKINNLKFADDIDLFEADRHEPHNNHILIIITTTSWSRVS